jgi:hypothetical protein
MLGIIWRISLLLLALTAVLADTEIRNFRVPLAGEPVQPTSPIIE